MSITDYFAIHFYLRGKKDQFSYRRLPSVPRIWEKVVFDKKRYTVESVEWCLDLDATSVGTRINIELKACK